MAKPDLANMVAFFCFLGALVQSLNKQYYENIKLIHGKGFYAFSCPLSHVFYGGKKLRKSF